jgi:hypothetical protein
MKRALLIGINYPGTGHALRGCVNDAKNMERMLRDAFGFSDIKLLLDLDATTDAIKVGMKWLTNGASPGDVLVMHYSGHGSQLPSSSEPDGYEEIICPMDLNWVDKIVTDNDLRLAFNDVPNGVNTTVILDCCHSGGGMNHSDSYSTAVTKSVDAVPVIGDGSRYLEPPEGLTDDRTHVVEWSTARDINASSLMLAAAHSDQTSADANIGAIYQGAHTYALTTQVLADPSVTYLDLTDRITAYMMSNGFSQRPELDGFGGLYRSQFVQPFGPAVAATVPPTAPTVPVVAAPEVKKNSNLMLYIGAAIVVAVMVYAFILH